MPSPIQVTPLTPRLLINRRTPGEFKVCPLCGALNVRENTHCSCCSWGGAFHTDSEKIQLRMWEMVDQSPELQMLLLKELRTPWWRKALSWAKSSLRRPLDLRA